MLYDQELTSFEARFQGEDMIRSFHRIAAASLLVGVMATGLVGCSKAPSEADQNSVKAELSARGFTNPRWESYADTYTVGVGKCRFPIRLGEKDWLITVGSKSAIGANLAPAQGSCELLRNRGVLPVEASFSTGSVPL